MVTVLLELMNIITEPKQFSHLTCNVYVIKNKRLKIYPEGSVAIFA